MKRLFIHHPLFRLLSPLFSGTLVYLLILLINNTINELGENFFGQELYVCIALAYLIQELARLSIVIFRHLNRPKSFLLRLVLQVVSTFLATIVLVSGSMYLYFVKILHYEPNLTELLIFNSIFSVISLIYVLLYVSHQFLHKINVEKLQKEEWARLKMEEDFARFKQEINPLLLFESLEAILMVMKNNVDKAEEVTDSFASMYRHLLSNRKNEVIPLDQEMEALDEFLSVQEHLPYRRIQLVKSFKEKTWIIPGTLVQIIEVIMRSTIPSKTNELAIEILDSGNTIEIKYKHEEKLNKTLNINSLNKLENNYQYYSGTPLEVAHNPHDKTIKIPKLQML
ncbi:histidine kinase [Flagellimonas allohymeniacidonis]|uniref:Histidine kinase n=1 Tax=Flagellimonas allohymeniacidonis TaxID=2517819 RepID=A0A4V2HSR6_9FLAO|nr:histidine kinase [Allomuricauda hymeniacidonis]TAI48850.1 histidine kinase [Allomuricauda hymeniacidonis]